MVDERESLQRLDFLLETCRRRLNASGVALGFFPGGLEFEAPEPVEAGPLALREKDVFPVLPPILLQPLTIVRKRFIPARRVNPLVHGEVYGPSRVG